MVGFTTDDGRRNYHSKDAWSSMCKKVKHLAQHGVRIIVIQWTGCFGLLVYHSFQGWKMDVCVGGYLCACACLPSPAFPRLLAHTWSYPWHSDHDGCLRKGKQGLRWETRHLKCHPKASRVLLKRGMSYFLFCICSKNCSLSEHLGTRPRENIATLFLPAEEL